jgi:L-fuconolactonase
MTIAPFQAADEANAGRQERDKVIDGHTHVWVLDPQRYPWHQTLAHVPIPTTSASVEDLVEEMSKAEVTRAVLVQPSVYGWDNSYLCDALDRFPHLFAGVCLVDPRSARAGEELRYWCQERGCQGVRINLIGERDATWVLGKDQLGIWATAAELEVPVCLQMLPEQTTVAQSLAGRYPAIRFVVDGLGPDAARGDAGHVALRALAEGANIYYKVLTGSESSEPFPFRDLWPLYQTAFESFGPDRLLFGTDFPHVRAACRYDEATRLLGQLPFLDARAKQRIGEGTACELWDFGDAHPGCRDALNAGKPASIADLESKPTRDGGR